MENPHARYKSAGAPRYSGVKTFFGADQTQPEDLAENVDVGIFGVPFDGGVSNKPGTRYGPAGVRNATHRKAYTFEAEEERYNTATRRTASCASVAVRDCGDAPVVPNDIMETSELVAAYAQAVSEKTMPVLIGGDHYLTYPGFVGYSNSVEEDVGLLHLDAHRDTDTYGGNNFMGDHAHGTPMARINEEEYGSYANHAMVGIRGDMDKEFLRLTEEEGLHVEYMSDIKDRGIESTVRDAIDHVTEDVNHVYLTIDIDVTDPSFAPGTGTPSPGGLTSDQLLYAMDVLGGCNEIGAIDLMEVAPTLDPTNMTSTIAAKALKRLLQSYFYEPAA